MSEANNNPRTSGKAIASLVLGLLGFVLPVILSVPAIVLGIMGLNDVSAGRGRVGGRGLAIAGIVTGGLSMVVMGPVVLLLGLYMMLQPAVANVRAAAERVQGQNNLRQIGLALHNYHDTSNELPPPATTDAQGKPLLSWRVLILPYIEKANLYRQFKLDEPWDGPNNSRLLNQMPRIYALPTELQQGKLPTTTYYQVFIGPQTAFGEPGQTIRKLAPLQTNFPKLSLPNHFQDGTSNTVMVAEAATAVPWTKPEDLDFRPGQPLPRLGGQQAKGFNVLMADGSVRFIAVTVSEASLRAAITANAGDTPGADW